MADIPVPEDNDLDMEQYFESLVPRQFYHLSEADRLAPVYGNSPPDTMHFVPGGTFSPPLGYEVSEGPVQLSFTAQASLYLHGLHRPLSDNEELVVSYEADGTSTAVIERTHNVLTLQEANQNADACKAAILAELARW